MRRRAQLRGIGFMLFAVSAFAAMDASLKLLSGHYPPLQVAALRGLTSMPIVALWVLATRPMVDLLRVRWGLHLLRGALFLVMLTAFAYALRSLPLAEVYAIFFIAPLLIVVLAVPVLGESVSWPQGLAVAAGLFGVLVILRPDGTGVGTWAGLAVAASALAYATAAITGRVLSRSDSTQSMVFWMTLILAVGGTLLALPNWVPINPQHAGILTLVAVTGALGQYALTEAFRHADAAVVAPFEYTALLWGVGIDWWLWQLNPQTSTLVGAGIVVASGLFLVRYQAQGR